MATPFKQYVLLTGGHTGIGLGVTEKILVEHPDTKLGLIIRSEARKAETIDTFKKDLPENINVEDRIDFFYADLSDQAQVRQAGQSVASQWPQLNKVFCNAGIVATEYKESKSGNEMNLEINALAHVVLIQELLPLLKSSGGSVLVTTTDHMKGRKMDVSAFESKQPKGMLGWYPHSKQAAINLLFDMAPEDGSFRVRGVNPGPNKTSMTGSKNMPFIIRLIRPLLFSAPSVGTGRLYEAAYNHDDKTKVVLDYGKVVTLKYPMSDADKVALMAKIK